MEVAERERSAPAADAAIGPAALAELDRQLDTYRRPPTDTCTSQSGIEVALFRGGAPVRRERYHKSSCTFGDAAPTVTFGSVAAGR